VVGASLSGLILANYAYPKNYAFSFSLAFVGVMLSMFFLAFNREPAVKPKAAPVTDSKSFKEKVSAVLVQDKNFRFYLISRALNYIGWMAYGFIAVFAISRYNLPPAYSATFAAIISATAAIGYPIWGTMGDRFGQKRVILIADLIWAFSLALLFLFPSITMVYIVFGLIGFSTTGDVMGELNLAMEFGRIEDRPTYVGMARTLIGPVLLLAPLTGGLIVQFFDYRAMMGFSLAFALIGVFFLGTQVIEPRSIPKTEEKNITI